MKPKLVWALALAGGLAACQPGAPLVDQAALREHLTRSMKEAATTAAVAQTLHARGFACEEAKIAWAQRGTAYGCSHRSGAGFVNVELASWSNGSLAGYRMYETPQPLYGKAKAR